MQPHLERRSSDSSANTPGRSSSQTASAPVGVDAFKQLLIKHGQRYVRDGKPFCLASIEILEYEHVRKSKGAQPADDLDQLGRLVLKHQLRADDRVCAVSPGSFLVLLPDISIENARKVMERILHKLGSSHRKRNSSKNRASGVYQVASVAASAHSERVGAEPAKASVREFHIEALVEAVGYRIDLSGTICKATYGAADSDSAGAKFSGNQELWLDRYSAGCEWAPEYTNDHLTVSSVLAQDYWVPGKCVVLRVIRAVKPAATVQRKIDVSRVDELLKRLKVLQSIEHTGLSRVQDFHMGTRDELTIYVVESVPQGEPLSETTPISAREAVELIIQLSNLGIFLQSLVPPVSPVDFASRHIIRSGEGNFVFTDYQVPYVCSVLQTILDPLGRSQGLQTEKSLASLGKLIDELRRTSKEHDRVLSDLAERLLADPIPDSLNSMFKVRAEAQRIAQRLARP